jgi:hypothetical protein
VFPRGRCVGSRVLVYCCWKSGAVTSDCREERRSERSCVEGPRSEASGRNNRRYSKKGRHVVVPPRGRKCGGDQVLSVKGGK